MRILIVSDVSSWMRGGVPAETRGLVRGLVERGHVVALASDAPLRGAETALHLPLTLPVGKNSARELAAALASFSPDFVHLICMNSLGVLRLAPYLAAHRWALTIHSLSPHENKLHGWHGSDALHYLLRDLRYLPNSLMWRYVFKRVAIPRVVVHSDVVRSVAESYGAPDHRVEVIPLYFQPVEQRNDSGSALRHPDAPMLLTIGGIAHTKGQRDVVAALSALRRSYPGIRYEMVGEVRDASYLASMRALANQLGVGDRIAVHSTLDEESLSTLKSQADVYVQPSHEEGFCLAYAEAAAIVPRLVGTSTGAIEGMSRDDVGASVVPTGDPEALAHAIVEQLGKGLPSDHMSSRLRRLTERFSFAGYIAAHEAIYADVPVNK